jgi:hypothetical protein
MASVAPPPVALRAAVRLLLVALLAPLLLLGLAAAPASASVKNGPSVAFEWAWDSYTPGQYGNCTAAAHWTRSGSAQPRIVVGGLDCSSGWNFNETLEGDGDDYFEVYADCGGIELAYKTHIFDHSNTGSGFVLTPTDSSANFDLKTCTVDSLDLNYKRDNFGLDSEYHVTATVALGSPPVAGSGDLPGTTPSACESFDLASVSVDVNIPAAETDYVTYDLTIRGTVKDARAGVVARVIATDSRATTPPSYATQATNASMYGPAVQASGTAMPTQVGAAPASVTTLPGGGWKFTNLMSFITKAKWNGTGSAGFGGLKSSVLGAQLIMGPYYPTTWSAQRALPHKGVWGAMNNPFPNDPTNCRWYVGAPQSAYPGTTATTLDTMSPSSTTGSTSPFSALTGTPAPDDPEPSPTNTAPPPVDDGSCAGFSFTDPASWAGSGMCVLVQAVMGLIGAVGDVLHAVLSLASAIIDGIANLLMPPDGFMDDTMDSVGGVFDDSPLDDWYSGIDDGIESAKPDAAPPSGGKTAPGLVAPTDGGSYSGCQGPPIEWSYFEKVGMDSTLYIFDACSGSMKTLADWTHLLLTISVVFGSAFKCIELLTIAVGASKQAYAMGRFDWSDAAQNRHGDRA